MTTGMTKDIATVLTSPPLLAVTGGGGGGGGGVLKCKLSKLLVNILGRIICA